MNLYELFVKVGVDDQASKKVNSLSKSLGNGLAKAAKVGVAAVAAASAAVAALAKKSIEQYAEYEQLVGGVETLFGDSSGKLMEYANEAYRTAGLSANNYMSTVTSFSASLLQGLGGDTAEAVEIANQAVTDMADNANKMGTDISMIQNAYQGFAKDNYEMLDNLKLGYGGTQGEMARLINDSGVLGDAIEVTAETVNEVPFDKIIEAIHVIQTEMGITGTTAKEASTTIQGSVSAMKGAFDNLLVSVSGGGVAVETAVNNFSDSVETVLDNLLPRIETFIEGFGKAAEVMLPKIFDRIPELLEENLPRFVGLGVDVIKSLISGLTSDPDRLSRAVSDTLLILSQGISDILPEFVKGGAKLVASLVRGIAENAGDILTALTDGVLEAARELTSPQMIEELLLAATELLEALALGLRENIPKLVEAAPEIVFGLVEGIIQSAPEMVFASAELLASLLNPFSEESNTQILWKTGENTAKNLIKGIVRFVTSFYDVGEEIAGAIADGFTDFMEDPEEWLRDTLDGIIEELEKFAEELIDFFSFGWLYENEQSDPSKYIPGLVGGAGGSVGSAVDPSKVKDYSGAGHSGIVSGTAAGAVTGIGNVNINIEGARYSDEKKLTEEIARRLMEMTERRMLAYR